MTDRFKFRAWHHGGGDPRINGYMAYSHPFPVKFWESVYNEVLAVEVMQSTCLLDKNGKEIYEGDIIKENSTGLIYAIQYEDGCFYYATTRICQDSIDEYEIEIIGNVYENPDLWK